MKKQKRSDVRIRILLRPTVWMQKMKRGVHHTTARDLALIMRYAIRSETFLKITQTREYSFTDLDEKREFSVHNTNALLTMTDGGSFRKNRIYRGRGILLCVRLRKR